MSNTTKKYRIGQYVTLILSALLMFGPAIVYLFIGFSKAETDGVKYTMSVVAIFIIVMAVLNAMFKWHFKSLLWIMLIALGTFLDKVYVAILVFGICTIIDEVIVTPLHKYYKQKASINHEIDKRM